MTSQIKLSLILPSNLSTNGHGRVGIIGTLQNMRVSMMKVKVEHWSLGHPSWNYLAPALLNIGVARPNYSYL